MRTLAAMLLTLGTVIGGAAAASDATPRDAVLRALSVRHGAPSCADVEALTPAPVETLLWVVEEVELPPWAPVRAAECLATRHAAAVRDHLERWVVAPETRGLGRLVIERLDAVPVDLARDLAVRALSEGPEPERARARIARLRTPELRALAEVPR